MWRQIGIFTLNQNWQHSRPIDGILFRVRHLNVTQTRGQIAQGVLEGGDLQLFEKQRLLSSDFPDLFEFVTPLEPGKRRIAMRADAFSTPWRVALDYYDGGTVAPDYLALHHAHINADNPHNQYLSADAFYGALVNKVSFADLTAITTALAAKADLAAMTTALAAKADLVVMTAALAAKADLAAMTTALAAKADLVVMTAALAAKADLAAMTAALAAKADTITLTAQTTNATAIEMVTPQRVLIPANSAVGFEMQLMGRRMDGTTEFLYWLGSGALYRGATAASTVLQTATGTRRSTLGSVSTWTVNLFADTVNGGLKIELKGIAATVIKWVASIKLTEVS